MNPKVFDPFARLSLALLMMLVATSTSAAPMHWVYEAVDPEKTAGGHAAALDAQDHAHVVYGRDALHYDWQDADGWHSEVADTTSAPSGIAMVLGDADFPHVVYADMLSRTLKYAHRTPTGWSVETLAQDIFLGDLEAGGEPIAVCLDAGGRPHVGYIAKSTTSRMKYLSKDGSGWQATTVATGISTGLRANPKVAITIAVDGQPHLGCGTRYEVTHAWRDQSGWHSAQDPFGWALHIQLVFDDPGRLHVLWEDDDDAGWDGIRYMLWTGGMFVKKQIDPDGYPLLAVTPSGIPHVVFYQEFGGLKHWSEVGGASSKTTIQTFNYGGLTGLVLNDEDRPYVLYSAEEPPDYTSVWKSARLEADGWHAQHESLESEWDNRGQIQLLVTREQQARLAYSFNLFGDAPGTVFYCQDNAGWRERVLAQPALDSIFHISLALDAQRNPHVVFTGYNDMGFRYAWRDGTGWHMTPVEDGFWWGEHRGCDVAIDGLGRPHLVYLSHEGVRHSVLTDTGWQKSAVAGTSLSELSLALDGMGEPHLLAKEYREVTDQYYMVHLWQDGGGWQQESVALVSDSWSRQAFPEIMVDEAGGLHICYFDYFNNALMYGVRRAQAWQLTTVDNNGMWVGVQCSMDLDDQGQPHLVYAVVDPNELRYARWDDASWQISTVDSGGTVEGWEAGSAGGTSLCLAPDGTPHITYARENDNEGLMYARLGSAGWELVHLESGRDTYWSMYSSLVVDQQGRPHIACTNHGGRQNLAYLYAPPFALTGLTPPAGGPVRLDWQGALEGVGVDGAPTPSGPWSPVAEDLCGLACEMEVPPAMQYFRLRNPESP